MKTKKKQQIDMNLRFTGFKPLQKLTFKTKRLSRLLDQFTYWRSALLWFVIFVNTFLPLITSTFIYKNLDSIPLQIPIIHFAQSPESKFITTQDLTIILLTNLFIQGGAIIIGSKLFFKLKQTSILVLICSLFSTTFTYLSIYKTLQLFL